MRAGIRSVGLIAGTCLLTSCTTDQAGGIMGQVFGQAANTAVQRSVGTLVSSPAVASATQNLCGSDAWGICHNMTANVLSGFSEEFVKRMTQEDVRQLTEAREQAIYTGQPQVWTNPQSGASGSVTSTPAPPKPPAPVQVNALPGRVGTPPEMVAVGEQYTATKTANVRGGPATTYAVVDSLQANEPIMAIGKVKAGDWFMVGRGDVAIGYVAASLIARANVLPTTPAPATPPTPPANVEQTQVVMSAECYTTTQTVKLGDGTSQQAQVTSCRTPNGWAQV